jgi:hypothetical protein
MMSAMKTMFSSLIVALGVWCAGVGYAQEAIDFAKARQLLEKRNKGEALNADERAYLERAMAARRAQNPRAAAPAPWTEHLTPLTELGTSKYKDQDGGLYGGGSNEPPKAHLDAAMKEAAKIRPLDAEGNPSAEGKIVLMSVGMSNATNEYSMFVQQANRDAEKSSAVVLVDGAQGGQTGVRWADAAAPLWAQVDRRLQTAGVTARQVQAVWIKQAEAGPQSLGDFPKHAKVLQENLAKGLGHLKRKFPNLRIAYFSSRIYAGYAKTNLNPEPFAYETAFAMRWVIQDQIAGGAELNFDASRGEVKAPLVLWGPYLWADGKTARKADGLTYVEEDFTGDGTHPAQTGRQKVAGILLKFFKTDATAKGWFVGKK